MDVEVFPRVWKDGTKRILGGIRMYWNDNTIDQVGCVEECVEDSFRITLSPYEVILLFRIAHHLRSVYLSILDLNFARG